MPEGELLQVCMEEWRQMQRDEAKPPAGAEVQGLRGDDLVRVYNALARELGDKRRRLRLSEGSRTVDAEKTGQE